MLNILADSSKFVKLSNDPNITRETKFQKLLCRLRKKGIFSDEDYKMVYPNGSQPARMYGLPKIHKINNDKELPPFRPIISSIGTFNHGIATWLCKKMTPLIPSKYTTKDSFTFVEDLKRLNLDQKVMVSFDVVSLFTNVPLYETIDIAIDLFFSEYTSMRITRNELRELFIFATANTHFMFNGDLYDQIDGVAMGSPLGPVLANLFMGFHESNWINEFTGNVIFYRRYVDDIFAVFDNIEEAKRFFDYLNTQHVSIKFTMETEISNCLSFLDISVCNRERRSTSVYRKPTFTGLLTNFFSFTGYSYKVGLIRNLLYRAFHISSDWTIFHAEIEKIYKILLKNSYPRYLIDRVVKSFISKCVIKNNDVTTKDGNKESERTVRYYKLPYRGKFSEETQLKLDTISSRFCKSIKVKLVFTAFKIGQYLSPKDRLPDKYRSWVVYKFICPGCNTRYIGETSLHLTTRSDQHLRKKSQPSAVFKHLQSNSRCKELSNLKSFSVIDRANTRFALKIKEGLQITWDDPPLNKQVKHEKINISV